MTCTEFDAALDAYLAGTLSEAESLALEAHAAECAACEARLEAATRLPTVAAAVEPPSALRHATLAAVAHARASKRQRRWTLPLGVAAAAALVLMVLQPTPKRASDNVGGPIARLAETHARPELAELDAAERELTAALRDAPDDAELRGYLATVTARRAAIVRLMREASL